MNVTKGIVLVVLFVCTIPAGSKIFAQTLQQKASSGRQQFFLNGNITLDALTRSVHDQSGTRFSFNSVKVRGSRQINFKPGKYSLQDILQQIRLSTSLYFTYHSGYVIFQDNKPMPRKTKSLTAEKNTVAAKQYRHAAGKAEDAKVVKTAKHKLTAATVGPPQKATIKAVMKSDAGTGEVVMQQPADLAVTEGSTTRMMAATSSLIEKAADSTSTSKPVTTDSISGVKAPIQHLTATNKSLTKGNKLNLSFGLQWNFNIPVYGVDHYFTGANGKNQWYTGLIPGIWISKNIWTKRKELLFTVKPLHQYLPGNKTVATVITYPQPPDTLNVVQSNTTIIKTSGVYAGLQYNFYLTPVWSIGVGVNFNWQRAALAGKQKTLVNGDPVAGDSLYGITSSSPGWQYLSSTFFSGRVEAACNFKKVQAGLALSMPVGNMLSSSVGSFHPLNAQLFLRWAIRRKLPE